MQIPEKQIITLVSSGLHDMDFNGAVWLSWDLEIPTGEIHRPRR